MEDVSLEVNYILIFSKELFIWALHITNFIYIYIHVYMHIYKLNNRKYWFPQVCMVDGGR